MSNVDPYDWAWRARYLDKPRRERWAAIDHAKAEGHDFDVETLLDALGLDAESWAELFRHLPGEERLPAGRIEARRRGLPFSSPALLDAFSGERW